MNKTINSDALARWINRWRLKPEGDPFSTHSSVLLPARQDGRPVMLKLTPEPDEIRGGALLSWWDGKGAVRVLEREDGALLMERLVGHRSLAKLSMDGDDAEATVILCSVVAELHRTRDSPLPPLEPLETLFEPLFESESPDPLIRIGKASAHDLLTTQTDCVPLHGDIQHHNVLDAGDVWLVIDPKGQFGERTFDYVNIFRNPNEQFAADPAIVSRRIGQIEAHVGIDPERLRRWIAAFCALCLVWDYYPQGSPDHDRELARIVLS